jgi:hypothetical protein
MTSGGSSVGPRGQRFDAGEGPQTLAQLQDTGAEVVGSDGVSPHRCTRCRSLPHGRRISRH